MLGVLYLRSLDRCLAHESVSAGAGDGEILRSSESNTAVGSSVNKALKAVAADECPV